MFKITKSNFEKAIRKHGRPAKKHVESQDVDDEKPKGLKKTRLQQKSSISSSSSSSCSLDPFLALNMMPGITPESPKKDHFDSKPEMSKKGKDVVGVSRATPGNLMVKVCYWNLSQTYS
jgi:hypothetical protein